MRNWAVTSWSPGAFTGKSKHIFFALIGNFQLKLKAVLIIDCNDFHQRPWTDESSLIKGIKQLEDFTLLGKRLYVVSLFSGLKACTLLMARHVIFRLKSPWNKNLPIYECILLILLWPNHPCTCLLFFWRRDSYLSGFPVKMTSLSRVTDAGLLQLFCLLKFPL